MKTVTVTYTVYKVGGDGKLAVERSGAIEATELRHRLSNDGLPGLSHIEWDLIEDSGWNGHPADGHIGQAISAGDFYVGADKLYDHTPKYVVSRFDDLADYEI
jgi:hypothetical protein